MQSSKATRRNGMSFELQSLLESHEQPFVVIDREYRIVATNEAYRRTYCNGEEEVVGRPCFKVSHHNDIPCYQLGEDCPHSALFSGGKTCSCVHVHYDKDHRMHQVRVTAFPLRADDGEMYLGELVQEITVPEQATVTGPRMVGETAQFTACLEQLKLVAAAKPPVLLQGETGTGKELAASFIHDHSPRRDQPYLTVDCTTLTDTLFEAEVFGHARGAYTGSIGEKSGLFEQADGGTLFLDEIGEMPRAQQSKLLRILETGQFRRVGGRNTRKVDVRIICATNRHLWDAVRDGHFREDLYYRIACLTVRLPSLRERIDDLDVLSRSLLEPVCQTMQRRFHLTDDAIARLKTYDFPGNIRELRNILFVAVTHSRTDEINGTKIDQVIEQLTRGRTRQPGEQVRGPQEVAAASTRVPAAPVESGEPVSSLEANEARHISRLLERFGGNRRQVAQSLGISERTLYRKLKKYSLS